MIDLKKEKEIYLYHSFKSNFFIEDKNGERLENCKSRASLKINPYGKFCKKYEEDFFSGRLKLQFKYTSKLKSKIYCEEAELFSSSLSFKEIGNPFIFNLNRLGKIEGILLDEEEKQVKGYPFSIFYEDEKIPLKETKADGEGNFKVEVRESLLEKVIFTKEGYSPLILNNLEVKNAPEILILKGLGKFKVKLLFEGGIKPEIVSNLTKEIVFLKEEKFEEKGMISLNMTQNEINLEAELEEGIYKFKIKGEFFKKFISSPFVIYSKKEYDYFDKLNYFE